MKIFVKQSKHKIQKNNLFIGVFFLIVILTIAINPAKYSKVAFNGLQVWAKILVPSLLPFFIITKLFQSTGVTDGLLNLFSKPVKKIYNCPKQSAYVFFLSILSGYPVGSKIIADLYKSNEISKTDAIKTASFCSNSGPMFILGSVAIGMFANKTMGILILISHIFGALFNGVIYRNLGANNTLRTKTKHLKKQPKNNKININKNLDNKDTNNVDFSGNNLVQKEQSANQSKQNINLTESVNSSISSILLIGGVICFTFVILEIITTSKLFINLINLLSFNLIDKNLLISIFSGIGEITKGCLLLSSVPLSTKTATLLCTFIISFGGISTFLQAMSFLKDIVPAKTFFLQKLTHAVCSCIVCFLLLLFIPV